MDQLPAQENAQQSVSEEPVLSSTQSIPKFGLIVSIVILFLMIFGGLFWYLHFQKPKKSKKQWVGLLITDKGLVKINPQGILEKDAESQVKDIDSPVHIHKLLQDGRILFIGSPETPQSPQQNIIYVWNVDFTENPKPLLEAPADQKIQAFALSPDKKLAAVTFVTKTESDMQQEVYEKLDNQGLEKEKWSKEYEKIFAELEKELQEKRRIITIYETSTSRVVKTLKLEPLKPPSRRIGTLGRLLWNEAGLFALDHLETVLFDPNSWQVKQIIPYNWESILISPDGSKYLITDVNLAVRKIPGGEIIAKFNAPEFIAPEQVDGNKDDLEQIGWLGPSVFSQDSKKLLIQGRSIGTQTNFMIWELDTESGKTQKIGDSEILHNTGLKDQLTPDEWRRTRKKSAFHFLVYCPTGEKIFFAVNYPFGDRQGSTDLYQLKLGQPKAEFIHSFNSKMVGFWGWYLP